jgi:hypothetical protein
VRITVPLGINNRGQIVGFTASENAPGAARHGFVLARGVKGRFTPVDFPGAPRTQPAGINDLGQVTGVYENPNARPASGPTGMP